MFWECYTGALRTHCVFWYSAACRSVAWGLVYPAKSYYPFQRKVILNNPRPSLAHTRTYGPDVSLMPCERRTGIASWVGCARPRPRRASPENSPPESPPLPKSSPRRRVMRRHSRESANCASADAGDPLSHSDPLRRTGYPRPFHIPPSKCFIFSTRLLAGYGGLDGWPTGRPVPPEHKKSLRKPYPPPAVQSCNHRSPWDHAPWSLAIFYSDSFPIPWPFPLRRSSDT